MLRQGWGERPVLQALRAPAASHREEGAEREGLDFSAHWPTFLRMLDAPSGDIPRGRFVPSVGLLAFVALGSLVGAGPGSSLVARWVAPPIVAEETTEQGPGALRRWTTSAADDPHLREDPELAALVEKITSFHALDGPGREINWPGGQRSSELFALVAQRATPEQVQRLLAHPDPIVRFYAMEHIVAHLPDRIGALEPLLDDNAYVGPHGGCGQTLFSVANGTIFQLQDHKQVATTSLLLRAARRSRLLDVRANALHSLSFRPEAHRQVEALAEGFLERFVRGQVDPEFVDQKRNDGAFEKMLTGAILSLARIDAVRHRELVEQLASHHETSVREVVLGFFAELRHPDGASVLEQMQRDESEWVAEKAREAYARHPFRDEDRVEALLQAHPDDGGLWASLVVHVKPGSLARWQEHQSRHPKLLSAMLYAADKTDDPKAVGAMLCSMLDQRPPEAWVVERLSYRDNALTTLGTLRETRCVYHLNEALSGNEDEWLAAMLALADLGDRSILPRLRSILESDSPRIWSAGLILVRLGAHEAIPWLERAATRFRDRERRILLEYAEELRRIADRAAPPHAPR